MTDPTLRTVFAVMLGALFIAFAVMLVLAARPRSGERPLLRYAERCGLPVPAASAGDLEARMRRRRLVEAIGALVGISLAAILFAGPLGSEPLYPLAVLFPVFLVSNLIAETVITLREQLFHPRTDTPRLARPRAVGAADYIGPAARALPWIMAALVVAMAVWTTLGAGAPSLHLAAALVSALAVTVCLSIPVWDRAILARSQPATTPLELAWADALRADALNAVRSAAVALCVVAATLSVSVLLSAGDLVGWPLTLVNLAYLVVQRVYPTRGAPVPRGLFPDGIRVPAGSAA